MTKAELLAILAPLPDDATIDYRDGNFGGKGEDFTPHDIEIGKDGKTVLIRSPYWEDVNGSYE